MKIITLSKGAHTDVGQGVCLLEAASYLAGERFSDHPQCVSPVLGAFGRNLNDLLPDNARQGLLPLIPLLLGTAGDGKDKVRGFLAADWAVRVVAPIALRAKGLSDAAARLAALPVIRDEASAVVGRAAAQEARRSANAAYAAYAAYDAYDAAYAATAAATNAANAAYAAADAAYAATDTTAAASYAASAATATTAAASAAASVVWDLSIEFFRVLIEGVEPIRLGDIGKVKRVIEFEPLPDSAPVQEPAVEPEREPVPA